MPVHLLLAPLLRPPVPCPVIPNPADARSPDSPAVTVADYANSDPAVVKTGRVKKAVANAVQQEGESAEGSLPPRSAGLCLRWETPSPWAEKICLCCSSAESVLQDLGQEASKNC